jgi:hypothetical protein
MGDRGLQPRTLVVSNEERRVWQDGEESFCSGVWLGTGLQPQSPLGQQLQTLEAGVGSD